MSEPVPAAPAAVRRIRWWRVIAAAALILVVLVALAGIWFVQPQQVLPEADAALVSRETMLVDQDNGRITFAPAQGATTGLIFYPGAKVPAKGYATTARMIAEQGYLVVIPEMPFTFAVLDTNAADGVIAAHPEITHWAIGGHSLGGAMAGSYVAGHPDAVDGLVLWAAYSASDVADSEVVTAVIYGTLDAGAERITSPESLGLLPHDTVVTPIEGGNHANFGSYAGQPNDPEATIPREEQQRQAAAATVTVLQSISAGD